MRPANDVRSSAAAAAAPSQIVRVPAPSGPFDPDNDSAYRTWRAAKLAAYPAALRDLVVPVRDPRALTGDERRAIGDLCARANMAIYASPETAPDKDLPRLLARQFGLVRLDHNWLADDDGISSVTVRARPAAATTFRTPTGRSAGTPTATTTRRRGVSAPWCSTACESAASGGENALLDHEIAYLLCATPTRRSRAALMQSDAMTIPARTDDVGVVRGAETGPVFSVDPDSGALHMRYTARTRSIEWKDDAAVRAAAACLERVLAGPSPHIYRVTLQPGMGLLCNNVLHDRSGFADAPAGRGSSIARGTTTASRPDQ